MRNVVRALGVAAGAVALAGGMAVPAQASSEGNWVAMGRDFFTWAQCWHAHYDYMEPNDNGKDWKCELNGTWHSGQTYTLWIYYE